MTIEEIRKGASGATHYHKLSNMVVYLQGEVGYWYWWNPISIELDFSHIYDIFDVKPL